MSLGAGNSRVKTNQRQFARNLLSRVRPSRRLMLAILVPSPTGWICGGWNVRGSKESEAGISAESAGRAARRGGTVLARGHESARSRPARHGEHEFGDSKPRHEPCMNRGLSARRAASRGGLSPTPPLFCLTPASDVRRGQLVAIGSCTAGAVVAGAARSRTSRGEELNQLRRAERRPAPDDSTCRLDAAVLWAAAPAGDALKTLAAR